MRLRTSLTLVVLVALLVGGSFYGWRLLTENPPDLGADPTCEEEQQVATDRKLRAEEVRVNVYNAGSIDGLASTTMRSLSRRGFVEGVVDNAPENTKARNVLLLDPQPKSAQVQLVAAQFAGDVVIRRNRDDLGDGVDVFVGGRFRGIDDKAKTFVTVRGDTEECASTTGTP